LDLYITNSTDAQMIAQLRKLNATMNEAQRQVASGKRVQVASDSPADIQSIIQNQSDLARVQQSQANLNKLNSEVTMASTYLESAAKLMDQARAFGAQAASTTTDASTRQLLASQIQDIESQMVSLANATNTGRYLFSGDADTTAPYSLDFANTPPFMANTTALATRMGLDSMGNTFPISMTATDIFDNGTATTNGLQSIEDLRQGLINGDNAAILAANANLASSASHLSSVQAYYGTAQSTITASLDTASKSLLSLQTEQARLTDADMALAITAEQAAQTQQQAVLAMRAKMPRGSLFDMLG
jgi:flagellar hook-associated protein 3 FlgL